MQFALENQLFQQLPALAGNPVDEGGRRESFRRAKYGTVTSMYGRASVYMGLVSILYIQLREVACRIEVNKVLAANSMIEHASDINRSTLIFQRDEAQGDIYIPVRPHHNTN